MGGQEPLPGRSQCAWTRWRWVDGTWLPPAALCGHPPAIGPRAASAAALPAPLAPSPAPSGPSSPCGPLDSPTCRPPGCSSGSLAAAAMGRGAPSPRRPPSPPGPPQPRSMRYRSWPRWVDRPQRPPARQPAAAAAPLLPPHCCPRHRAAAAPLPQSEDLLNKRRDLLEKKIAAELNKAKEYQKKNNKKGARRRRMGCGCPERRATCVSRAGRLVAASAAHPLHCTLGLPPWPAGALAALRQKKMYEGQLEQVGWRSLLPLAVAPVHACGGCAGVRSHLLRLRGAARATECRISTPLLTPTAGRRLTTAWRGWGSSEQRWRT